MVVRRVARWWPDVNIFEMDKLFIVVNRKNLHWSMVVVFMRLKKRICYYDSMEIAFSGRTYLEGIMKWIHDRGETNGIIVDENDWVLLEHVNNMPQQNNGNDCGVFALLVADFMSDDMDLTFSQLEIPHFRTLISSAILQGKVCYSGFAINLV